MRPSIVVLSHFSALLYWHNLRMSSAANSHTSALWLGTDVYRPIACYSMSRLPQSVCGIKKLEPMLRSILQVTDDRPIDVLVGSKAGRTRSQGFANHMDTRSSLPSGQFYQVTKDVLIVSPELMFIELASVLTLYDLIEIGYMLCGTYTLDPSRDRPVHCPRLATVESINACISENEGLHGIKAAKRAIKYVIDGSNSPRETYSAISISLPRMLGGHGLPRPVLNKAVRYNGVCVYPDLLWEHKKVVVEYNGADHYGPGKGLHDDLKNNLYESCGLRAYTLTKDHFASEAALHRAVNDIRKLLGEQSQPDTAKWQKARQVLFRHYLHPDHGRCVAALLAYGQ